MSEPHYKTFLATALAAKRQKNGRYSLRAFARFLDIDAGVLSRIMTGKRPPALDTAERLISALKLTRDERRMFLESVVQDKGRKTLSIAGLQDDLKPEVQSIPSELFKIICDPLHYAILELTFSKDFIAKPQAIAKRLGVTTVEAEVAIARLLEVNLLKRDGKKLLKTNKHITTHDKQSTTQALQNRYVASLDLAKRALQKEPISRRNMTSMTMCIDPTRIPTAKAMIEEFTDKLCSYLEGGTRLEIFELAINLFSLEASLRQKL